jgi:7,8-dihydro-6-hydroxymethylpterin dimethyltransferase
MGLVSGKDCVCSSLERMYFNVNEWHRIDAGGASLYISSAEPNWFVPNEKGESVLKTLRQGISFNGDLSAVRFLSRLPSAGAGSFSYPGRHHLLQCDRLGELWFHVTNKCNMSCAHCLFSSSSSEKSELSATRILSYADEAYREGCRLFVLTGGEPLVHPEIEKIVSCLLSMKDAHVVMLTNGSLLVPFMERLRPDPACFHVQLSFDGIGETHDSIRGAGSFSKLQKTLSWMHGRDYPYTLSFCPTAGNISELSLAVDFASACGASNFHLLWYFIRGRAARSAFADIDSLYDHVVSAALVAEERNLPIDNLRALRTQIFAPPGTLHDGTSAGWESVAVGTDGLIYPSAALVGTPELATDAANGLASAWRSSPVLGRIRKTTALAQQSPFRFLLGGGDIDHSYISRGAFMGCDPYQPLQERLALWMIKRELYGDSQAPGPSVMLQMGDIIESCGAHGSVALIHSNCLIATAGNDSLTMIKQFYAEAAGDKKKDILNPVCYEASMISHIPEEFRFRGYGCGSPVLDAGIQSGECVVDLGCGAGVEVFIASRLSGPSGSVTGVDMLDPMLELAGKAGTAVERSLGYRNFEFRKGYLESLPVDSDSVDVALSNCVMNLSLNKRRAYAEIHRILRPGGRVVISDVVCESEPGGSVRNDEQLYGECIAGALTEPHLMGLIESTGFRNVKLLKRFPYRQVSGHQFYSLTYMATKPDTADRIRVIYRGPLAQIMTETGEILMRGITAEIDRLEADALGDQVFVIDEQGSVTNVTFANTCGCLAPPEKKTDHTSEMSLATEHVSDRILQGCMVCGGHVVYSATPRERTCSYCGLSFASNAFCETGHYVCDKCHTADATDIIRRACLSSGETDMIELFKHIRSHKAFPLHGPQYHALTPGIILATYRNRGGKLPDGAIEAGISRGGSVAGGFCGFMGVCGAAVGVGVAFSVILAANPLKPAERQAAQSAAAAALNAIASKKAARCCQRDVVLSLRKAAELSAAFLPVKLRAEGDLFCSQHGLNRECAGALCPLYND